MIISRTPFRISFFGGGTDYPGWYRRHGGAVLAATIDKYCYLTVRYLPPFFEHRFRVVYSKVDMVQKVEEISHPAAREVLKFLGIERGLEIHHDGDLPARSGIGSSSSFTVGLLHALYALQGKMPSKHQLALESIHVEHDLLKETVGAQDQVMAAYGGLNHVRFHREGEITVSPVPLDMARIRELDDHLMLFYTGVRPASPSTAGTYVKSLDQKEKELRDLEGLVKEGLTVIGSGSGLEAFGSLLHEGWKIKRGLSEQVSNPVIDQAYEAARSAGALGGKVTGAGGGGFMLLFAAPSRQGKIREALKSLIQVPFNLEFSGSQILFLDRERDYASAEADRKGRETGTFRESEAAPS